jgi:hypothetical protein
MEHLKVLLFFIVPKRSKDMTYGPLQFLSYFNTSFSYGCKDEESNEVTLSHVRLILPYKKYVIMTFTGNGQ